MANSYLLYTGNGSTTQYSLTGIDGWISTGFIKVYFNDSVVPEATNTYTFVDLTTSPKIQFNTAPANNTVIRIQRETPATVSLFRSNVVDFEDTSILTASDLDKSVQGLIHVVQEANDTGSGALGPTADGSHWNAESKRITNTGVPTDLNDAANKAYVDGMTLYGTAAVTVPQAWTFSGDSTTTDFTLSPAAATTDPAMFIVEVGGTILRPTTDYTVTSSTLSFVSAPATATDNIRVRNLGVTRAVQSFPSTVSFGQNVNVAGNINTSGNILGTNVGANVFAGLGLGITGPSYLTGTLNVTGTSTLAGVNAGATSMTSASVSGALGVTGASTLASLGVTNNATVGGTLGVTGASTLGALGAGASTLSSLAVTNNATVGGTLGVTGVLTPSGGMGASVVNAYYGPNPASGTVAAEYIGLPSWAKRIVVTFANLNINISGLFMVQIGAGSYPASVGYATKGIMPGITWGILANGFVVGGGATSIVANGDYSGSLTLNRMSSDGNVWHGSGEIFRHDVDQYGLFSGWYSPSPSAGMIDRIRFTTQSGTALFGPGIVSFHWE